MSRTASARLGQASHKLHQPCSIGVRCSAESVSACMLVIQSSIQCGPQAHAEPLAEPPAKLESRTASERFMVTLARQLSQAAAGERQTPKAISRRLQFARAQLSWCGGTATGTRIAQQTNEMLLKCGLAMLVGALVLAEVRWRADSVTDGNRLQPSA